MSCACKIRKEIESERDLHVERAVMAARVEWDRESLRLGKVNLISSLVSYCHNAFVNTCNRYYCTPDLILKDNWKQLLRPGCYRRETDLSSRPKRFIG